jgi:hypothetical protein
MKGHSQQTLSTSNSREWRVELREANLIGYELGSREIELSREEWQEVN